jgi:hypothetical protein
MYKTAYNKILPKKNSEGLFCGPSEMSLFDKTRILVPRWMRIGPFASELKGEVPLDKTNPNGSYTGLNGEVKWEDVTLVPEETGIIIDNSICASDEPCSLYLATYVYSRKIHDCFLTIRHQGSLELFHNGNRLGGALFPPDSDVFGIELIHGWNLLMLRLDYSPDDDKSFYAGLCHADGEPFRDGWVKTGFMTNGDIDTQLFCKNPGEDNQYIEIGYISGNEHLRSRPDAVVYIPREGDRHNDGDNEHFLVFNAPKSRELLAMWTQGSMEPSGDNHIVLSRSSDGVKFSDPIWIAGTHKDTDETQASWGIPMVASKTGRIYCFYCETPKGKLGGASGVLGCRISDDNGYTWSYAGRIELEDCFKSKGSSKIPQGEIIAWQKPIRDRNGRVIVGYTYKGRDCPKSCCRFMAFDNIDDGPELEDIQITYLSSLGNSIEMPADVSERHCSEPAPVLLPDGRIFSVMRTVTGNIWYSLSEDDGYNWAAARPLLYRDGGEAVRNPLNCCPLYPLEDGKYILLYCDNSFYADYVRRGEPLPAGMSMFTNRRPMVYSIGEFKPDADQPLWFSQPRELFDTDGVIVSPKATNEIGSYPSMTVFKGERMLWYPDRKFFLLGKKITREMINS